MHFTKHTVFFTLIAISAALPQGRRGRQGGQPGDPVTSGLPADIQEQVDDGTLSCVLNSNGDAACSDQFGASDVFPISNANNDAGNGANDRDNGGGNDAGSDAGNDANDGGNADGQPGDPVTSGLPADIQEQVDDGTLSCVLNSNGDAACSDASGASNVFPINDAGNDAGDNANDGGNGGGNDAGNNEGNDANDAGNDANDGGDAGGQPGDPVTSGLPADVQEQVDDGTLSCVLNSNGQAACSDASGASFIATR